MKRFFLIAFFMAVVGELTGLLFSLSYLHLVAKPTLVLLLIGYYWIVSAQRSIPFVIGLVACWAGDVLLMLTGSEWFFVLGLLSFLLGHIFYIVSYRQHRWREAKGELLTPQKIRFSFPIVLWGTGVIVILFPLLGVLKMPVVVYGIVLILMCMNALFRYGFTTRRSFWLVFCGALLFQLSDSLLAFNKFHSEFHNSGVWIMLTYMSAQFLIVEGIIRHK